MGNCCGKEEGTGLGGSSSGGNFKGQGRTLGGGGDAPPRQAAARPTTDAPPARASVPPAASGPGRTLGEPSAGGDAKSAAAAAAEARAAKTVGTDKLSQNLAAQKKAGMRGALADAADENRRLRENDAAAEARNWS